MMEFVLSACKDHINSYTFSTCHIYRRVVSSKIATEGRDNKGEWKSITLAVSHSVGHFIACLCCFMFHDVNAIVVCLETSLRNDLLR